MSEDSRRLAPTWAEATESSCQKSKGYSFGPWRARAAGGARQELVERGLAQVRGEAGAPDHALLLEADHPGAAGAALDHQGVGAVAAVQDRADGHGAGALVGGLDDGVCGGDQLVVLVPGE